MNSLTTTQNMEQIPLRGYVYAALIVVIWAGFILISRVGGISPLTSWDVIAIRYATAATVILPFWWFRHRVNLLQRRMFLLASLGGLGYAILAFTSFKTAPAAHAAVLLPGLLPFSIAISALVLIGEVPSANRVTGLIIIATGVACLAVDVFDHKVGVLRGDMFMVGASFFWASYTVLIRRWAVSPWDAMIGVTLLTAFVYLPIYLTILPKHWQVATWANIATQAIYQGIIATIIQMVLYVRTIELIGPTRLGVLMAFVPVLAGVAAVPILKESLSSWVLIGLVLVGVGAWLGNRLNIVKEGEK